MASSRLIVAGEAYTADDINNLRADVLDNAAGHDHDGTDGKKIAFSDLDVTTGTAGSAAPSGGTHGYDDIDDHLDTSVGVHGLNASANVLGCGTAAWMVVAGSASLVGSTKIVSFSPPFSSTTYFAVATMQAAPVPPGHPTNDQGPWITTKTTSSFTVNTGDEYNNATFDWIAIGLNSA